MENKYLVKAYKMTGQQTEVDISLMVSKLCEVEGYKVHSFTVVDRKTKKWPWSKVKVGRTLVFLLERKKNFVR